MRAATVAQFLTVSLLLVVAGCGSKPAATPDSASSANPANSNSSPSPNSSGDQRCGSNVPAVGSCTGARSAAPTAADCDSRWNNVDGHAGSDTQFADRE